MQFHEVQSNYPFFNKPGYKSSLQNNDYWRVKLPEILKKSRVKK